MPTNYEIMELVNRIEDVLYGDPSRDKKGLVERVNNLEDFVKELREMFRKILWAAVIGALATVANFFLNTKNISTQQHSPPASTQPK